jgi:hypothetical protein
MTCAPHQKIACNRKPGMIDDPYCRVLGSTNCTSPVNLAHGVNA